MKANRETTSNAMGLVLSALLHAIFFAACFAFDATSAVNQSTQDPHATEMNVANHTTPVKPNS